MLRDWGVTRWLAGGRPEGSTPLFELLSLPGDLVIIVMGLGVVIFLDVTRSLRAIETDDSLCRPHTWSIVAVVLGGLASIVALESIFALSRPPETLHAVEANPYGFPSGHTMGATICWGALAWWYRPGNPGIRMAAVSGVVALVGLARLTLGLHYLPDVIAAVAFGIGYLVVVGGFTIGQPDRAFLIAIGIAAIAVVVSVADPRSVIAFVGVIGGKLAWQVTEHRRVQAIVRSTATRFG